MMFNLDKTAPRCGEIWMCKYYESEGSIQKGKRPVYILSNDKNNAFSTIVNVIPLTGQMRKKKLPIHVELWNHQLYGLKKPSIMLVEQIRTVSIDDLERCIGKIEDKAMQNKISRAIMIQFPVLTAS